MSTVMGVIGGLSFPERFGNGGDGNITVTGTNVNITAIYENDTVAGVTTKRGAGKGLFKGAGTYNPKANQTNNKATSVFNCISFTIETGASLLVTAWGAATDDKKGIGWVACINKFTNRGAINFNNGGGAGGPKVYGDIIGTNGFDGKGIGHGHGGECGGNSGDTPGGDAYGSAPLPLTTWSQIYGSGGGSGGSAQYFWDLDDYSVNGTGGGGAGHITAGNNAPNEQQSWNGAELGPGGKGGDGGGALRIYATMFDTVSGTVSVNGQNGESILDYGPFTSASSGGGGGSGGTVFIETIAGALLGTNKITATAGIHGVGAGNIGNAGNGKQGRIHIVGPYTGSTNDPAIA